MRGLVRIIAIGTLLSGCTTNSKPPEAPNIIFEGNIYENQISDEETKGIVYEICRTSSRTVRLDTLAGEVRVRSKNFINQNRRLRMDIVQRKPKDQRDFVGTLRFTDNGCDGFNEGDRASIAQNGNHYDYPFDSLSEEDRIQFRDIYSDKIYFIHKNSK